MNTDQPKNFYLYKRKHSVNPSVKCDRESTDHQSDLSNFDQSSSDCARSSDPQLPSFISHLLSSTAAAVSTPTAYSL